MKRRVLAWSRGIALLVILVVVVRLGVELLPDWRKHGGFETYWIAQALVAGEGYSLPAGHALYCRTVLCASPFWTFGFVSDSKPQS